MSVWEAYGTRYSMMLLMVCLSTMMTAIWMKRSVMQPLGWHWRGQQDKLYHATRVGGPKGPFGRCYGRKLSFPEASWALGKGRGVVCGVREQVPHLL